MPDQPTEAPQATHAQESAPQRDLSCRRWIAYAAFLLLLFGIAHLAGLRTYTAALSGTSSGGLLRDGLGIAYVLLYMGAVFLAPLLLLASGFVVLFRVCAGNLGKGRSLLQSSKAA